QNDDLLKALNAIDQAVNLLTEVSQKPNLVSDEKASVLTYLSLALSKKLDIISIINPDNTKMGPELGKKLLAINDQLELKDKMIIPYQHLINFYVGKNQHKKVKSLFRDAYILVNKQIVDARNKKSWLLKYKLSSIRKLKKDEAYYYLSLSDWNRSLEIADELKAYEKDDLSAFEIHEKTDLLNLYGLIYRGLGKKKLAIKYFLNALDILNKAHKKSLDQETTLLSNLALAYQDIGNYKLANKYINEVGERVQMQSGHELYKVKTYNNIAAISIDMNIKEKYLLKSYDVYENNSGIIDKDLGYVNTITLLTEYHVYKQDYKTAEKYLLKAHDYVLKNMDKNIFKFGTYLYFYSDLIAINHQDYDACIYFSKKYTDALEKINNKSSELIKFYSHIAICHYKKNEKEIYFDYLYKMMSILINEFEQNNLNLTFEVSDTIKKNKKYVHFFINSVMEFSHNNPEILNKYSDINFHDLIFVLQQMIKANKLSINLSQAISREMSKNDEISLIIKQYSNLIDKRKNLMNISSWSKKYIERINEELKQTDMTISKLKTKIYEVYPDFEKNFTHQIISASMLQNTIDDGQAVIQISVGKYSSIVSVISKENYKIYRLKNADKKNIKSLVKNIRDSIQLENNLPKKFDKNSSSELYKILFDDRIKKILEHKEKLIIIPDGPLYSIPYELLFDNDSDKWLVEKYAITVYPSIYSFSALNNNIAFNKSNSFLGLGNPKIQDDRVADNSKFLKDAELEFSNIFTRGGSVDLKYLKLFPELPETEVELKRIASKFDNNSKLYLRERFNEKQLKKINFSNFKVVNFATHALVVGEIDGLSEPAIVLSLPKKISDHDDGLLTAKEIIKMKLNNDLIILSACNTASSDGSSSGEALSGLANSFFYSGARSLLVTHWAIISDTSVDLVSDTFDFLNESDGDLSIALRKSKIKMLKNPKTSHPIYWAPYTLVGRSKLNSL
ncbi:MAG: CHAT domain-containing protein, partial [Pelagibacterales bacterium]|nr:CHAT domain-containing protein [Pelagibacterales bacterium]